MSAIFGIYRLDQRPLCQDNLVKMRSALAHYGPDGSDIWCDDSIGLGHQMMYFTPESLHEPLPRKLDQLVITADARLDNREELCALLAISYPERATIPDSELILFAYQKWGDGCPNYLLGDFAFAIWDGSQQHVFCARDQMGIRPFFYHHTHDLFVFASDVRGVIAHPEVPRDLNELSLAMHLRDPCFNHRTMTFLLAVQKLPAAHVLIVSANGIRLQRYWHPAGCPAIRMKDIDAYAEALRDLLEKSVECRLRTSYPVGAHLSGGLDSSTIAVLAGRILRQRGISLPTYNWIHLPGANEDPEQPEFAFSRILCEQEGFSHENINLTAQDVLEQLSLDITRHHAVNFWYEPLVQQAARRQGVRLILSGWGGDELVTFNGRGYYAELFWDFSWLKLAQAVHWRGKTGARRNPFGTIYRWLGTIYSRVILPSLPDWLYRLIDRYWLAPMWSGCATQEFAAFIKHFPTQPQEDVRERVGLHANQVALLEQGYLEQRIEGWAASGADNQLQYAYPLLDKRIVEFSLGIPPDLYVQNGYPRFIFRCAVKGVLPDKLRWGNVKREPQRVEHILDVETQAARAWLAKADAEGRLAQPNRYIDVAALTSLARRNWDPVDEIKSVRTLINSIQVLNVGWTQ